MERLILFFAFTILLLVCPAALAQTPTPTPKPTPNYVGTVDCQSLHDFCYNEWYRSTLNDCKFRQEGSGAPWSYSSCECQAARDYGTCMDFMKDWPSSEGTGCWQKKNSSIPASCITPPPPADEDEGCGDLCDEDRPWTPVMVDVLGDGFVLTNAANGVRFDLNADGSPDVIAWTQAGSDDAWLTLDRNGNGLIDNGKELFGNFTYQPDSPNRNGFLALAVFDTDKDGLITAHDSGFDKLRLWRDQNHNGISETDELTTLYANSVTAIELDYKESKRVDEHGNEFRYRAKISDIKGSKVGRWAWDVFLTRQ